MALNLLMLGPPGAGKGTQAERLARTRGIPKISTGDILRDAVSAGTEVGRRAKAIMDRGELVSDDVMIGIVKERLERADALAGFVLDGFPRTVPQAAALDAIMDGRDPLIIVNVVVPEVELVRRLASRLICEDCGANAAIKESAANGVDRPWMAGAGGSEPEAVFARRATTEPLRCRRCGGRLVQRSDDNVEVVRERLKVYHNQSKPLVEFYKGRPTFRSIDGAQSSDRVATDLVTAIGEAGDGLLRWGARS
ncbi:MAG: adenylate kinase [Acidobacteria bacterium]|nr:MAG: adenylate kinase [Acidobacteriota bacterium]